MTPRVRLYVYQAALENGVDTATVLSADRSHRAAVARWQVMKRLRADGFSLGQIGRWLDRDHSTVIHGLRRAG